MTLFWNSDTSAPFWGSPTSLFWVTGTSDSASYAYDSLGRLIRVTYANGTYITYNYDPMGNRSSVVITCGTDGC